MYHANNPRVVEVPDDIESIESAQYADGESLLLTVTFKLKPGKQYNPQLLFATNGVDSRMLPLTLIDPTPIPAHKPKEVVAEVKVTPIVEDAPKKSRSKRQVDSEE